MKTSNVVLGVLAGAAVGALLGILYAPDKGSVTRRKIAQKSSDVAQGIKDEVSHLVEKVTQPFHAERKEPNGQAEASKMKLTEARK